MLRHLHVKDLAIVDSLELELGPGLTALTGETGAGKSILIDALGLALGDRADSGMIRAGRERAEITAVFDLSDQVEAAAWLEEHDLDDGGECILRRVLNVRGRGRAFINGSPAPIQSLQALGDSLVDIQGQHAHQSLLRRDRQRLLLDAYAGHEPLAAEVANLYRGYRREQEQLDALRAAAADRATRIDFLRHQVGELLDLGLEPEELRQLDEEHARLSHAGQLQETCGQTIALLYEDEASVNGLLGRAAADIARLQAIDPALGETRELLEAALIQVDEASSNLRHYAAGLDMDPRQLERVEQRLAAIHDLARKHRVTPEELPARQAALQADLDQLENADVHLSELEQRVEALRGDYMEQARELSAQRHAAAARLGEQVTAAMQELGMAGGRLAVELEAVPEDQPAPGGLERPEFLVSANPGQAPQPLAKVASGGELSRISLAIQVVTAQCGQVPTLIFDEVDVGIGGRVAEIVGQLLRRLGESRQVLCVTHLPQVAAQGHGHLRVRKHSKKQETRAEITPLVEQDRVDEIARMLGGIEITEQTRAHATEMIGRAQG